MCAKLRPIKIGDIVVDLKYNNLWKYYENYPGDYFLHKVINIKGRKVTVQNLQDNNIRKTRTRYYRKATDEEIASHIARKMLDE
jgi:hypothetical protein